MFFYNKHFPTFQIYTTFLSISFMEMVYDSDNVWMYGCYGDMISGEVENIEIETNFKMLGILLDELENDSARGAQKAIRFISDTIARSNEDCTEIDFSDIGGLNFENNIFIFTLLFERLALEEAGEPAEEVAEPEEGEAEPDDPCYSISGFIRNRNLLPRFFGDDSTPLMEDTALYNQLLAIRFLFYLQCKEDMPDKKAKFESGLTDPLVFELSKIQYHALGGFDMDDEG